MAGSPLISIPARVSLSTTEILSMLFCIVWLEKPSLSLLTAKPSIFRYSVSLYVLIRQVVRESFINIILLYANAENSNVELLVIVRLSPVKLINLSILALSIILLFARTLILKLLTFSTLTFSPTKPIP